jgi:hypothetical protein
MAVILRPDITLLARNRILIALSHDTADRSIIVAVGITEVVDWAL